MALQELEWFKTIHQRELSVFPARVYREIHAFLHYNSSEDNYEAIKNFFAELDIERMSTIAIIVILRYSFFLRDQPVGYYDFLAKTEKEFAKRGENSVRLLSGLRRVPEDRINKYEQADFE